MTRAPLLVVVVLVAALTSACATSPPISGPPCDEPGSSAVILMAQAVPTATLVPCVAAVPTGWYVEVTEVRDGSATMSMNDADTTGSVELTFTPSCDPGDAVEVAPGPGEEQATVLQAPDSLDPLRGRRFVVFEGGCVTSTYDFPPGLPAAQALEADLAFSFLPRADVVAAVAADDGAILCGAGAPPCEGA